MDKMRKVGASPFLSPVSDGGDRKEKTDDAAGCDSTPLCVVVGDSNTAFSSNDTLPSLLASHGVK